MDELTAILVVSEEHRVHDLDTMLEGRLVIVERGVDYQHIS